MKKLFFIFYLFLIIFLIFAGYIYKEINYPTSSFYEETFFEINQGETLKIISSHLKEENIISNPNIFYLYFYLNHDPTKIKAGTYKLNSFMTVKEISQEFFNTNYIQEKIKILEGWTINDIGEYLEEKNLFKKEDFYLVAGKSGENPSLDFSNEFTFLENKPKELSLEGYLFPDTYYITKNDSPEDIVKMMLKNFEKKVINLYEIENINKIITMASIIEKEVWIKKDKNLIAGILWKRINYGMRLQVDATVLYANQDKDQHVSYTDTETISPFNTYEIKGLPIGPISNPGAESILAAMNPKESEYWYYLSARDGTTIFSKNYNDHLTNKYRYLK